MWLKLRCLLIVCSVVLLGCKNDVKQTKETEKKQEVLSLRHAKGFAVKIYEGYKVLEIKSPWPNSEATYKFALVDKNSPIKVNLKKDVFDAVIATPIQDIVVTSTTHLPALELLEEDEALIGFPGTDYVSSELFRTRITENKIRELGKNEGINTEVLLELHPDVVIGFGIDGNNKTFETIQKANIPVIYNGDWVEDSPLAKAEWIKFFGVLFNKEQEAAQIYSKIESDYLEAKNIAATVKNKPSILSGAMHKDIWYLPSGTSAEAKFLKDANTNYLWKNTTGSGSLSLNFETVFTKAKAADIWINPSYYGSYSDLETGNTHYTKFDAFKAKRIFTIANTKGETGGVLYYELGLSRPDLVLKDIIKICHPELLPEYDLFFFKALP